MGQQYTIAKVSQEPPREYYNETYKSTTYYIKVQLEGHDKPVTVGKKRPDALKVGDTVYGRIVPTQYDTDKWQPEQQAPAPNATYTPKDQDTIRAQWAIGQAVSLFTSGKDEKIGDIEKNACDFFVMVDRVKEARNSLAAEIQKVFTPDAPPKDQVYDDVPNEPINLDDVPFNRGR